MQITKVIQKKNPLNLEQLKGLWDRMVEARNIMAKSKEELDAMKDAYKDLCEQQNSIIDECFKDYERGFTTEKVGCVVSYDGKVAIYTNAETGEVVDGVPLEDGEQLEMTGGEGDDEKDNEDE